MVPLGHARRLHGGIERSAGVGIQPPAQVGKQGSARGVAGQVEMERGHGIHFAFRWLMADAWYPAPKPLSMFTTDTPEAHEFSMASSAATPPNEAP